MQLLFVSSWNISGQIIVERGLFGMAECIDYLKWGRGVLESDGREVALYCTYKEGGLGGGRGRGRGGEVQPRHQLHCPCYVTCTVPKKFI